MTRPINISPRDARNSSFDQPFEMLEACHERVHRMLKLLGRLREHMRQHGADSQAQQAARDIMRYFDLAAPQHHRDEELHVFPALLSDADDAMLALVSRLQQDHLQMDALWPKARHVLMAVADGALPQLVPEHEQALDAFAGLYGDHIAAEEEVVYPAARARLDEGALRTMGDEMAHRRGVR